jgi:hypothetical protein
MTCHPSKNVSDARKATIASSHGLSVIDHLSSKVSVFRVRIDTKLRTSRRFQITASLITSIVSYRLNEPLVIPSEVAVGWSAFVPPIESMGPPTYRDQALRSLDIAWVTMCFSTPA